MSSRISILESTPFTTERIEMVTSFRNEDWQSEIQIL